MGQTATFSVEADTAGAPGSYQWFWNGWRLRGATQPSFTTRPAEVADNGSTYTVEVVNSYGSANATATLTVNPVPRAPKVGDLRFQGVDAAPTRIHLLTINFPSGSQVTYFEAAGTPLLTGSGVCGPPVPHPPPRTCSWGYMVFAMPPSAPRTNVMYTNGELNELETALNALATPDSIITSLYLEDLEDPAARWALSRVQLADGGGFYVRRHSVLALDLAAAIAREGAASRVVTAIYFHRGDAYFFSYGWTGDPTTVYETTVANASLATAAIEAGSLATAGYIVTALGLDSAGGVVLVGTRVAGDTMPRPLRTLSGYLGGAQLIEQGFAIVGYLYDESTHTSTWIGEQ